MSLLTEEQIEEVVYIFLRNRDSNAVVIKSAMENWNKKQQPAQFEPDWSKAPEGTYSVIIKSYWVGEGAYIFGQIDAEYERPAPVITPHPHADIMMKYAEVAARRVDPWVEFEGSSDGESWGDCISPISFPNCFKYRHIGDDK